MLFKSGQRNDAGHTCCHHETYTEEREPQRSKGKENKSTWLDPGVLDDFTRHVVPRRFCNVLVT